MATDPAWPPLPYKEWKDTYDTLHMWSQVVGKVRLVLSPWLNHNWHATFYITPRGLTSSPIPYEKRTFQADFDFFDHTLRISTNEGVTRTMALRPRSVANFYKEFFTHLDELGFHVRIHTVPNEVVEAIPFDQDEVHASYDAEAVQRCLQVQVQADRVLKQFRARFIGKASPVHLFWGSFDLAATRFSGRKAPPHPGGVPNCPDWVMRDAYSHEVSSCGFWPGNDALPYPLFYAYAYPVPPGFPLAKVRPPEAYFDATFGEFILPYDLMRQADSPDAVLLDFLQSTYEAAADLAHWDRAALEWNGPQRA
jgi:hypothetical protein